MAHVSMFAGPIAAPHGPTWAPISVSISTVLIFSGHVVRISIPPSCLPPGRYVDVVEYLAAVVSPPGVEVIYI